MSAVSVRILREGLRTALQGRLGVAGCARRNFGMTRGLSSLCRSYPVLRSLKCTVSVPQLGTYRYAHTAGDQEMVAFLKDEIKMEKEGVKAGDKLPKLKGFEVTKTEGPNVTLIRKAENETIVIKLNVNNSVDESFNEAEARQEEAKDSQMVSKPSFVVEINKGGPKTLAIQCIFPPEDDVPPAEREGEHYEDLIEIQDVALLDKAQEWSDDVYSLSGGLMDGNLYDMLLKLLEERGIDGELVHQLVEFSTSYEHKKYVTLLEQLQEFASSK